MSHPAHSAYFEFDSNLILPTYYEAVLCTQCDIAIACAGSLRRHSKSCHRSKWQSNDVPSYLCSMQVGWVHTACISSRFMYRYIHQTSIGRNAWDRCSIDVWHTLYDARGRQQPLAGKSLSRHCSVSAHCHLPQQPPFTILVQNSIYLIQPHGTVQSSRVHCGIAGRLIMDAQFDID